MNNKGLTLIEVIAVLVVLSIIALIVTPNIAVSINDYKERILESQLSSVKGATKNWVADNIEKVTCASDDLSALMVDLNTLYTGAYIDDKLLNSNGGHLDADKTFGLVACKVIEDETNNYATNYKYEYGAYLDVDDYLKKMAIEYVKDHTKYNADVSTDDLKGDGYIYQSIVKTNGSSVTIPEKTIAVTVDNSSDGSTTYSATIK